MMQSWGNWLYRAWQWKEVNFATGPAGMLVIDTKATFWKAFKGLAETGLQFHVGMQGTIWLERPLDQLVFMSSHVIRMT
jgi:hypothetical protein